MLLFQNRKRNLSWCRDIYKSFKFGTEAKERAYGRYNTATGQDDIFAFNVRVVVITVVISAVVLLPAISACSYCRHLCK